MDEQKPDEQQSWKRLIFAYAGAGVVVLAIAFFIARGVSQNSMIVAHAGATPTPSIVGVYSGIAPDATQAPRQPDAASPSPSPQPSQSASPAPHASASPAKHPDKIASAALAPAIRKHAARSRAKMTLADTDTSASDDSHVVPIVHSAARQALAPKPEISAPPVTVEQATEAPTAAPAPATTEAPQPNEPIFAPQRIVDAQLRVAVQPEYTEIDRERGAKGTSVVLVTIDPKGNVVSAVVGSSSGYSSLDRAAMSAARSSQFVAPKINGHPATETYRVVYDFAP